MFVILAQVLSLVFISDAFSPGGLTSARKERWQNPPKSVVASFLCVHHVANRQPRSGCLRMNSASPVEQTSAPKTSPLSAGTFAGEVEQALLQRYDGTKIRKVIESWRLADLGYEHREFVGPHQSPPILDATHSQCHQHAPSYVPGLKAVAWWDNVDKLSWAKQLSQSFGAIREEFLSVTSDAEKLETQGNNIWAGALTADAEGYGEGWKTLVLLNRGQWDATNAELFPVTSRAIHQSGAPAVEAFFASMKPRTDIKPHSDFTNFVLTSHLPLVIPENGKNKCRLTIGDNERQWIEGKVILFDTSILHDAINESDEMRYILMLRIWHPDLSEEERGALQFIYDCLEIPELLSDEPGAVFMAEQRAKMMRSFPLADEPIKTGGKNVGGGFAIGDGIGKKGRGKKKGKRVAGKGFGS